MVIKTRYRVYTNREFVLQFRRGKLKNQGYGGGYFLLPVIDELIVLTTTVQTLEVDAGENIITKENQEVKVNGLVIWRIEDPVKAYQSISGGRTGVMSEINITLAKLVESIIRTTVARLSLDQVLRERGLIIEAIMEELFPVVEPMGIRINTAEIRHVDVVDTQLFSDLQEKYRQEAKLAAEKKVIETRQEILKTEAFATQQVKLYEAEQMEAAQVRELAKDKKVLLEMQKLNEAEELRLRSVQELAKKREAEVARLDQEKLRVEAETRLIEIELEAESKKRQYILEEIDVQAQQKIRIAKAEADAIKMQAQARREAIEQEADAEAYKLEKVAEARKMSLLAEAEGQKALLMAEAEGLAEKVKAQGFVNEAMIMKSLVEQLPAIASSMKVGDINWLNMGGSDKNGDSPLGIIPKNILQLMTMGKSFGLDIEGLIRTIRGGSNNSKSQEKITSEESVPLIEEAN